MKYFYIFLFFAFGFSSVNSQNDHKDYLPKNIVKGYSGKFLEWVVDSIYCYKYNEDAGQIIEHVRTFNLEFANDGQVSKELTEVFEDGKWQKNRLLSTEYTSGFNTQVELFEMWDNTQGAWIKSRKISYSYNADDLLTELLVENFIQATGLWEKESRNIYVYFNLAEPAEFTSQIWEEDKWENFFQIFYSYNSNSQVTSSIFRNWDATSGKWINGNQTFDSYDSDFNLTKTIREIWNSNSSDWDNSTRTAYEYVSVGNLDRVINEIWINQDSTWSFTNDNLYGYDFRQRNNEFTIRNHDGTEFQNFYRNKRKFDNFDNVVKAENQFFQGGFWVNESYCDLFYNQRETSNTKTTSPNFDKTLKKIGNNLFILQDKDASNSPLTFRAFDISGKLIYSQKVFSNTPFFLDISGGIRVLTIYSDEGLVLTKKAFFNN